MKKKLIFAIVFLFLCPVMAQGRQQEITENIEQESPVDIGQEKPEDNPITLADAEEMEGQLYRNGFKII